MTGFFYWCLHKGKGLQKTFWLNNKLDLKFPVMQQHYDMKPSLDPKVRPHSHVMCKLYRKQHAKLSHVFEKVSYIDQLQWLNTF